MGLFLSKGAGQGCVLLAGNVSIELTTAFVQQAQQAPQKAHSLAVCQFVHATSGERFSVDQVNGQDVLTCHADLTDAQALARGIKKLKKAGYVVELAVVAPSTFKPIATVDITAQEIQQRWQSDSLTAVAVAQVLVQHMLKLEQGTIVFLGAGQSVAANNLLATGTVHAGMRALSQSLAREFQPQGLHISYVGLKHWDGQSQQIVQAIVDTCWHLYQQPDSAWSQELSC